MAPNFVQPLLHVPRDDSRSKASHARENVRRWSRASCPALACMQQTPLSVHAWLRWIMARDFGSEEEAGINYKVPASRTYVLKFGWWHRG